jgi:hypothetical protein
MALPPNCRRGRWFANSFGNARKEEQHRGRKSDPRQGVRVDHLRFRRCDRDSEVLANAVLAEFLTELGTPTTLQDSYRLYMGKRWVDVLAAIRHRINGDRGQRYRVQLSGCGADRGLLEP